MDVADKLERQAAGQEELLQRLLRHIGTLFPPVDARAGTDYDVPVKRNAAREFSVVIERDEDGWLVASVPALPGCHTQARSLDRLISRVQKAIGLYLEVEKTSVN